MILEHMLWNKNEKSIDRDFRIIKRFVAISIDGKPIDEATKLFINEMLRRYYFHMKNAFDAQMQYRFWGTLTSILTPLLGATVTALSIFQAPQIFSILTGMLVFAFGMIQHTYKFSDGFQKYAGILIDLKNWSTNFEFNLKTKLSQDPTLSDDSSQDFIRKTDLEMSEIGRKSTTAIVPSFIIPLNKITSFLNMENKDGKL
jgi:hypothetical protein